MTGTEIEDDPGIVTVIDVEEVALEAEVIEIETVIVVPGAMSDAGDPETETETVLVKDLLANEAELQSRRYLQHRQP